VPVDSLCRKGHEGEEAVTPTSTNMIVCRMPPITSGSIAASRQPDMVASVEPTVRAKRGDKLHFALRPDRLHFFDTASEAAI